MCHLHHFLCVLLHSLPHPYRSHSRGLLSAFSFISSYSVLIFRFPFRLFILLSCTLCVSITHLSFHVIPCSFHFSPHFSQVPSEGPLISFHFFYFLFFCFCFFRLSIPLFSFTHSALHPSTMGFSSICPFPFLVTFSPFFICFPALLSSLSILIFFFSVLSSTHHSCLHSLTYFQSHTITVFPSLFFFIHYHLVSLI